MVTERLRASWKKFRDVGSLLCKMGLSLKLKGILYKVYVQSVLSYGAECWAVKVEDIKKLVSTEMRMLRMSCGKTLKNQLKNEIVWEMVRVKLISQFLQKHRLRWLEDLERMKAERGTAKAQF